MTPKELDETPKTRSISPPRNCTHSRLISESVTEEEHNDGKVRRVECGDIIPDPSL